MMIRALIPIALAGAASHALASPPSEPSATPFAPALSAFSQESDRQSLERLLEEIKLKRTQRLQALRPEVIAIIASIDEVKSRGKTATSDSKKRELIALGPDAQPLLIQFLNPGTGETVTPGSRTRARVVAEVMHDVPYRGVTDALLDEVRTGTALSRAGALYALRTTEEPERALAVLIPLIDNLGSRAEDAPGEGPAGGDGDLGERGDDIYTAIACLDSPAASQFLAKEISGRNADRRRMALEGIRYAPTKSGAPQILLLMASDSAASLAGSIAGYYSANESLLAESDHIDGVTALALSREISNDARRNLFDILRLADSKLSSTHKRRIEKAFSDAADPEVRRGALMLLARNGDRGSKRSILDPFQERIERDRNVAMILRERAQVLHDIGDWSGAVKDWRDVMKLQQAGRNIGSDTIVFVGIAKSLARQRKFREASEYLGSSPLSLDALRALATDRDFREMAESKYADAFHLRE